MDNELPERKQVTFGYECGQKEKVENVVFNSGKAINSRTQMFIYLLIGNTSSVRLVSKNRILMSAS